MSGSLPDVVVTAPQPSTPAPAPVASAALWLRKLSIVVADQGGQGKELIVPVTPQGDSLHVVFSVRHLTTSTPSVLALRIYNLSKDTATFISSLGKDIQNAAFDTANGQVIVKAGYAGNFGTIFSGSVRYVKVGRENPTDTYVDVFGATWDLATNWGTVNVTLKDGHAQTDVVDAAVKEMSSTYGTHGAGDPPKADDTLPVTPPAQSPRGRALYGNAKDILRDVADSHSNTWSIGDDGKVNFLQRSAYLPGDAVVLNAHSGLIGLPELQPDGVHIRALLNPAIKPGRRIQINNASIQQPTPQFGIGGPNIFPSLAADGFYKVVVASHTGDNRGQNWYTDAICVSTDPSSTLPANVKDFPIGIPP